MTAREIALELFKRGVTPNPERNHTAPRLTELREAGKVEAQTKALFSNRAHGVGMANPGTVTRGDHPHTPYQTTAD